MYSTATEVLIILSLIVSIFGVLMVLDSLQTKGDRLLNRLSMGLLGCCFVAAFPSLVYFLWVVGYLDYSLLLGWLK